MSSLAGEVSIVPNCALTHWDGNTPVAFLVFNRPDCTRRTLAAIREAQPKHLLVVADGPRDNHPEEAERCAEVRALIAEGVDWPCQVETNYASSNLGCRERVSSGLDWVFSRVEEAIILEDDCLPHPSFFPYCEQLLDRYRKDPRVMMIAGTGMDRIPSSPLYSYRFSKICYIWGWASWRRAWKHYDVEMRLWPQFADADCLQDVFTYPHMRKLWASALEAVYQRKLDTWDYQWSFASFTQNCVNVVPMANLVSNIGFTADATHTHSPQNFYANRPLEEMCFPIKHPAFVLADNLADLHVAIPDLLRPFWKRVARRVLPTRWRSALREVMSILTTKLLKGKLCA